MNVDYIIIGQGLCGTLLSYELLAAGHKVLVIDNKETTAAARTAGGLINPVTGKRLVRSWMADELISCAFSKYQSVGHMLNATIINQTDIIDFFPTQDTQAIFAGRAAAEGSGLYLADDAAKWTEYFNFHHSAGRIAPAYLLNIQLMMSLWQQVLVEKGAYMHAHYEESLLECDDTGITYNGINARGIIYCDGVMSSFSRYWERLPWSYDKGEVLIAEIDDLPRNHIFRQGISILPWKDNLFWIGASHDWKASANGPTTAFKEHTTAMLDKWLKKPYRITDHMAAMRPANFDRKPFVGFHPVYSRVGILNGMGGKGCSIAPFFAAQLARYITYGTPLMAEASVARYTGVLTAG